MPKVSIGMPVFNGVFFIAQALDSLLAQTFRDFELIISDNASVDGTDAVCREYQNRDPRIRFVRQPANLGATANFQFVLDEAAGEYFMWAAADDRWAPDFITRNIKNLASRADCIGSITPACKGDICDPVKTGYFPIDAGSFDARLDAFMRVPGSNARFYSLFRTCVLKSIPVRDFSYLAGDWGIVIETLKHGNYCLAEGGYGIFLSSGGASADIVALHDRHREYAIELVIPFWKLQRYVIGVAGWRLWILAIFVHWNMRFAKKYWTLRISRTRAVTALRRVVSRTKTKT